MNTSAGSGAGRDPGARWTLRRARESDLAAVAEIYNDEVANGVATFDTEPRSIEDVKAWLLGKSSLALVALEGEEVVGFSALYPWSPRKGYERTSENTVYSRRDRRGAGIGTVLLQAILEEGRKAGRHAVVARISSENEASVRLHRKFGFEKIGTMKEVGFKFGRLLDVELMQVLL